MAISAETISVATTKGLKVTEVPISAIYTKDGSTMNPIRHGLGVLHRIIVMISERRPLFFFGLGGLILSVIGLIAGIRVLLVVSGGGMIPVGTVLVSVLLLVVGIFSIFTGIILYVLVKGRS